MSGLTDEGRRGMDDAGLVRQALAGEADAYAALVDRWAGHILAFCHAQLGGTCPPVVPSRLLTPNWTPCTPAEERARDVLLRAYDDLVTLPDMQRFAPWLAVQALAPPEGHNGCTTIQAPSPAQASEWLSRVGRLPAELRVVVWTHYCQEKSPRTSPLGYRGLGRFLDLSPATIGSRLLRARYLLRNVPPAPSPSVEPPEPLFPTTDPPERDCEQYRALLSARLDNEIREQESELLDIHLGECEVCRSLAAEWADQHQALDISFEPFRQAATLFTARVKAEFLGRGPRKCSVLVVDDEAYLLPTLKALLSPYFEVMTANGVEAAIAVFSQRPIDIVLSDQRMPGKTGVQLLEWVRQNHPSTIRLLMTGFSELDDAIEAINRGHVYHYLLKPWRTEDLLQVLRNAADKFELERKRDRYLSELQALNRELERRVAERTRELEEANLLLQQRTRELERLALTDPLTGLFNRRATDELVRFELKRHARYPSALTLGYVDVDHFKQVNTEYLLTGGDEVLKGLARILTASLREVDSVGRVGGEEFLVIARETGLEGAHVLAERIRSTVEATPIEYNGKKIPITVSVGFAVAETGVPAENHQLMQLAAAALAHAKLSGRNRCEIRVLGSVPDSAPV